MKNNKSNIDPNSNSVNNPEVFFKKVSPPFEKSRKEVWTELEGKLSEEPSRKLLNFRVKRIIYGIAATIIILAGIFSVMRFYTKTVICPEGKHLSCVLPDGSKIELNVDSKIAYKPFWWWYSRDLKFEGEAYFQIEKGKKFSVESSRATTEVIGTTFNIYARDKEYRVTCITGRVRVTSYNKKTATLSPNIEGSVNPDGIIIIQNNLKPEENAAWVKNIFNFTAKPLSEVFMEIGRQYGVEIEVEAGADNIYTGYFMKDKPVEEVLSLVCRPFGLNFTRVSDKEYKIFQN